MVRKKERKPRSDSFLADVWEDLFVENERRFRDEKSPLTDVELRMLARKRMPDAAPTSVQRVSQFRWYYNNGENVFARQGPAGRAGRPLSYRYDELGRRVISKRSRLRPRKRVPRDGFTPRRELERAISRKRKKELARKRRLR